MKPITVIRKTTSVLTGPEKRLQQLIGGAEPKNSREREMVKQIAEIERKKRVIEIPAD